MVCREQGAASRRGGHWGSGRAMAHRLEPGGTTVHISAILRRGFVGLAIVILAVLAAGVPAAVLAGPPSSNGTVEVTAAVQHDVSAPLSHLSPTSPSSATLRERPLRFTGPGSSPNQPDGAVQAPAATQVATSSGLN